MSIKRQGGGATGRALLGNEQWQLIQQHCQTMISILTLVSSNGLFRGNCLIFFSSKFTQIFLSWVRIRSTPSIFAWTGTSDLQQSPSPRAKALGLSGMLKVLGLACPSKNIGDGSLILALTKDVAPPNHNFFIFIHFSEKNWQISRLVSALGIAPLENPRFVTVVG